MCSFCIRDTNMAFKHIRVSVLWSAKCVIMGHLDDTAFLPGQKTHITMHVGDIYFFFFFFARAEKPTSPHSEHSAVLPLTPDTISNRQTC